LVTAFVVLVASAIATVIGVMDVHQKQTIEDLHVQKGFAIGHSLSAAAAGALLSYNYVALQQLTQRAAQEEGVRYVIVLDKEGLVAGYSERPEMQGRRLEDQVSLAAEGSAWTLVQRVTSPQMGRYPGLDIAVPVYVDGSPQRWGTVRVGLSLDTLHQARAHTRMWGLGTGLGVLFLAVFVALVLARHITGPLKLLVEGTRELARGNFEYRVGVSTGDEFEDLSRKFEAMAVEIRQKQREVERTNRELAILNAGLEDEVQSRTRALMEAEEKYRILVEQSPNPICIIQEGRLYFFNEALCRTFGYEPGDLEPPDFEFRELLDPREEISLRAWLEVLEGSRVEVPEEMVGRHRDGSRIHLDVRSTTITFRDAPAIEVVLLDVTQQRQLQERVVAYERLRALGEMAGGVAHDFNNVLGAILGRAQYLQRMVKGDKAREGLRIIEKAAQDGAETVKRIQDFTRVRTETDFEPVDLNAVLEDVVEMTRSRWQDAAQREGKSIEIVRDMTDVPLVMGQISELREAFTNLVLNAVDAIRHEGAVRVATARDGSRILVSIGDDGEGMTPEVQRRLFDPFFTTKGTQGTGLGMSLVYGIMGRHGAEITVRSRPGEGTEFLISFPGAPSEASLPVPGNGASPERKGSGRVLVVDDEEHIRSLLADILVDVGYDVETARDGTRGLKLIEARTFDLVITDLGMTDVTGWDVARECRRRDPGMGVILITGWAASLDPLEVASHGIARTLRKPFEMDEVLEAVEEVIRARSLPRSA
jgi:PAS domain S-box-containing protein